MKVFFLISASMTAIAVLVLHQTPASPASKESVDAIKVIDGPAPSITTLPEATPDPVIMPETVQQASTVNNATSESEQAPLNTATTDEPFASQTRNPEWAGRIEASIAPRLPSGGTIICADFMCKASIPLHGTEAGVDSEGDVEAADQRAALATVNWPSEITYNQKTAQLIRGNDGIMLTFFVTRNSWPDPA